MTSSGWTALADLGQSVWYDNVARPALASGHLERLVRDDGVTGGTSNSSIFSKAVLESALYDADIRSAPDADSDEQVFERCAVEDIQRACDLLRPVWERTGGQDGHVSIEERVDAGEDVRAIASVASFFVSRVDTQADRRLPEDSPLRGRVAVANAKLAYADVLAPVVGRRVGSG